METRRDERRNGDAPGVAAPEASKCPSDQTENDSTLSPRPPEVNDAGPPWTAEEVREEARKARERVGGDTSCEGIARGFGWPVERCDEPVLRWTGGVLVLPDGPNTRILVATWLGEEELDGAVRQALSGWFICAGGRTLRHTTAEARELRRIFVEVFEVGS